MKEIDSLATNEENVDVVERNLTSFRFSVEELKSGFAALLNDLESEEDLDVANEWYINQSGKINDFLDKTVLWISTAKETIEHSLETRSQVGSIYSTSHRSKASSRHSSRSITSSRAKEKAKAAELMARVAMLDKRKELELRVEKLRLEEQLAVVRVREGVFAEIERGVGDADSTGRQELSPKDSSVQASTSSEPFLPTSSSAYTSPTVTSNTMTKVSFTADLYDAPMIQTPPKPMQHPSLNPFAPEFHVVEMKQDTQPLGQPKQEPFASEPRYMAYTHQNRWRREANRRRVAGGVIPSFADFVNFVNAEAGIATDPVFSREAFRRLDGTSDRPDRSSKGREALCNAVGTGESVTAVPVVPVRLKSAESEVLTYAMLDTCSTGSFVIDDIATTLGVKGVNTQLMVKTVNGTKLHDSKVLNGLIVMDLKGKNPIQLPKIFTKEDLCTPPNVPTPELAHR
ncbi:unnamed protein product [Porites evermanni]|uniref:Uncharacterized protein n=1 Tax=Porites evermanni TaxID=104178 RepID=A0ABN8L961_9CNID|nr:unnamed protein product [Porites evermanni]